MYVSSFPESRAHPLHHRLCTQYIVAADSRRGALSAGRLVTSLPFLGGFELRLPFTCVWERSLQLPRKVLVLLSHAQTDQKLPCSGVSVD